MKFAARRVGFLGADEHGVARLHDALREAGIANVLDLLTTYPRRYVDRTNEAHVENLVEGVEAVVLVKVRSVRRVPLRNRRSMVTVMVGDATGSFGLTFFMGCQGAGRLGWPLGGSVLRLCIAAGAGALVVASGQSNPQWLYLVVIASLLGYVGMMVAGTLRRPWAST